MTDFPSELPNVPLTARSPSGGLAGTPRGIAENRPCCGILSKKGESEATTPPKVRIVMMRCINQKARWLATVGLVLSFGVAALSSPPIEAAADGTQIDSHSWVVGSCCCKEDGRCCGKCDMACCASRRAPDKEPTPRPSNDDGRGWRTNLLAFIAAKSPVACNETTGGSPFSAAGSDANRSLAESTLQTRRVRLDA